MKVSLRLLRDLEDAIMILKADVKPLMNSEMKVAEARPGMSWFDNTDYVARRLQNTIHVLESAYDFLSLK